MAQKKYRFHDEKPDLYISIDHLQAVTRKNLALLNSLFGIEFSDRAWVWKVQARELGAKITAGEWAKGKIIPGKFLQSIRVLGKWNKHKVEYWRHESGGPQSGQTNLYIDGKKWTDFNITNLKEWPESIPLTTAVKNRDKNALLYLSMYQGYSWYRKIIRFTARMLGVKPC